MISTAPMPAPVAAFHATPALDADDAGLPTWLYRSEAFAEDLPGADDAPAARPNGRPNGRTSGRTNGRLSPLANASLNDRTAARRGPTLLYAATLGAALLALWPAAGLLA